ncbi:MAG: Gmad2 immunoglobulin-like domain-containing protein [Chloroflexota bacterium]
MFRSLFLLVILSVIAAACAPAAEALVEPTPTAVPLPLATPTTEPVVITPQLLGNLKYTLPDVEDRDYTFQLKDGLYQSGSDPAAADYVSVTMDQILTMGDINGDLLEDAAVLLTMNRADTGPFVWLVALLNVNGSVQQAAYFPVDDRPLINRFVIENGEIFLDAVAHGFQDEGGYPELPVQYRLRLTPGGLILISAATKPGDRWREIAIDFPLEDNRVSGSVEARGGVSVMPFEANLNYRIFSEQGEEYRLSFLMVEAPDWDQPGTFVETIDLADIPAGTIYLEFVEYSAADGSILALKAVRLIVE